MEFLSEHPILEFNPDTLLAVRKIYNLDKPGRMDEAIDILDKWIKQQSHFLKKDFPRRYLEFTIISSKGSLERAKDRVDKCFTFRTLLPQFFGDFDVKNDFQTLDTVHHSLLPKLTKDNYRVILIKSWGQKFDPAYILQCIRLVIIYLEHTKMHDYFDGVIYVIDISEANIAEKVKSFNLVDVREGLSIILKGYGLRIKAVHLITSSKLVDVLLSALKPFISSKVFNRITVHNSIESVYEHVPKDMFPVEYGGKERPLQKIHDQWVDILSSKQTRELLQSMKQACVDESLRQTNVFNDQYMGLPGTFRVMSVD